MPVLAGFPRALLGWVVLALALRWGAALAGVSGPENSDAADYRDFAGSLSDGKGYGYTPGNRASLMASLRNRSLGDGRDWVPTAFRPPGYPLFLAAAHLFSASRLMILLAQGILGALTVAILYGAARTLVPERAALVTAAFAALTPFQIYFSLQGISEALFVCLLAVLVHLMARGMATRKLWVLAAAGLIHGALILVRPQGGFFAPGILIVLWRITRGNVRERFGMIGSWAGGAAIVLLPWVARNIAVLDAPVLFSTLSTCS